MSISKDSFKERVLRICDKWYFKKDLFDNLVLWEKPFTHLHGTEHYPVAWWDQKHNYTNADVHKLRGMHEIRVRGLQMQVIEEMTGRNKKRQEAHSRKFHHTNEEIFKLGQNIFKRDRNTSGITRNGIRNSMKGVAWDDTNRVINNTLEYAEKFKAGDAPANHPHIIMEMERKIASGEQKRMVPA